MLATLVEGDHNILVSLNASYLWSCLSLMHLEVHLDDLDSISVCSFEEPGASYFAGPHFAWTQTGLFLLLNCPDELLVSLNLIEQTPHSSRSKPSPALPQAINLPGSSNVEMEGSHLRSLECAAARPPLFPSSTLPRGEDVYGRKKYYNPDLCSIFRSFPLLKPAPG